MADDKEKERDQKENPKVDNPPNKTRGDNISRKENFKIKPENAPQKDPKGKDE